MPSELSFPKCERMCLNRHVGLLFGAGSNSQSVYPLRVVWRTTERAEGDHPVKLLISVPKKRLHHAVDRNRTKRQIREAWRLRHTPLLQSVPDGKQLLVALVWLKAALAPSSLIADRIGTVVDTLTDALKGQKIVAQGSALG